MPILCDIYVHVNSYTITRIVPVDMPPSFPPPPPPPGFFVVPMGCGGPADTHASFVYIANVWKLSTSHVYVRVHNVMAIFTNLKGDKLSLVLRMKSIQTNIFCGKSRT